MSFWETVEDSREFRNLTRKELASKANFSIASISTGMARDSIPSADIALRISKVLGVSVEYLVTGKDSAQEAALPPETRKLVTLFASLNKEEREAFLSLLEVIASQHSATP